SQVITVQDTKDPEITKEASDMMVECDGAGNEAELAAWLASYGGAIAVDNCSEDLTWSVGDVVFSDGCGLTGIAKVTFTVTDECNNSSETTADFIIKDTTPPSIDTEAMDMVVECDGAGNETVLDEWLESYGGAMASDTCSDKPLEWSVGAVEFSDDCGLTGSATVVFTVTDNCENSATTSATFTIKDTTPPTIDAGAEDMYVECDGEGNVEEFNAWLADYGGAKASDLCSDEELSWSNDYCAGAENLKTVDGSAEWLAFMNVFETDANGGGFVFPSGWGVADAVAEVDAENNTVTLKPNRIGDADPFWQTGDLFGNKVMDASTFIADNSLVGQSFTWSGFVSSNTLDEEYESYAFIRIFTADFALLEEIKAPLIDDQGFAVTYNNTQADAVNIQYGFNVRGRNANFDSSFDEAYDALGSIVVEEARCDFSDDCGLTGEVTVTFTAMDNCGNASSTAASFIIKDETAPVITTEAEDMTVECGPGGEPSCTYYVQLFDSFQDGWQGDSLDVLLNGEVVLEDLTLADLFGGESPIEGENDPIPFQVQNGDGVTTIYFEGAFAGEASWIILNSNQEVVGEGDGGNPIDITAECDGEGSAGSMEQFEAWLANNGGASASDLCGGVTWSNNSEGLSDDCGFTGTETVVFTATDDCNNSEITTATFTIIDTTDPSIDVEAEDETVECDGEGNEDELQAWLDDNGGAEASDLCGSVTWSNDYDKLSDDCGETGSAVVTFTATDECLNTSTTSATFTIEDTTAPDFTFVPEDAELECDEEDPIANATAEDGCGDTSVTYEDYYTHTPWQAFNQGDGTTDFSALPNGFTVTGSNAGGDDDFSTVNFFNIGFTTAKNVILTFDWSINIEDSFGPGFDNLVYAINGEVFTIYDGPDAEASDSFSVELLAGQEFAIGIFNPDQCCGTATVEVSNINFEINNECPVTKCFIREFTAEDECGNKSIARQNVVFLDRTAPTFTAPADLTIYSDDKCEYDASVEVTGDVEDEMDNCSDEL
ncbi:hypothetical protein RM697_13635, partial [Ichthyenterobacterium sp. W332]